MKTKEEVDQAFEYAKKDEAAFKNIERLKEKIDIEIGFKFRQTPSLNFKGRIEFGYAVFEEE